MATILAMDTSATPVSCAILKEDRLIASFYSHSGMTHSQTLMPMVLSALSAASMEMSDIDAIAVSAGPGSFTGVRIGVSAAKGLAFANELPCVAVSTLSAMAKNIAEIPFDGVVCCVMDARCRQVYCALFSQDEQGNQQRLMPDEAISIDELQQRLTALDRRVMLIGDGSQLCYDSLAAHIPHITIAPISVRYQSAVGVAQEARDAIARGETISAEALVPIYLRLPQAERELRRRQAE